MEVKAYLQSYIKKVSPVLDEIFQKEAKRAAKVDPLCSQMMRLYQQFAKGGKMIRGALAYLGYRGAGGKNEKVALTASATLEILQSFLLMHDDWIDQDVVRRGKPTMHVQYEKVFKQKKWSGDASRWAAGMAIVLGDAGCFLAVRILADLDCRAEFKTKALARLADYLVKTAYGEVLDISHGLMKGVSYQDILQARELKTAYYTIVMPLVVGATLGGANDSQMKAIERYGLAMGIAFQLRDDELGLLGDEQVLGKSSLADLLDGKKTLLILKAVENLSDQEKKILLSVWGKSQASQEEIAKTKKLILKSGALEFSQKTAKNLVKKGKRFVPQITTNPEVQETLYQMADFMVERKK